MMQTRDIDEFRFLGAALVALGISLAGAGAAAGLLAADHMATAAAFCGPAVEHCALCLAADALVCASVGAIGAGLRFLMKHRLGPQPAA